MNHAFFDVDGVDGESFPRLNIRFEEVHGCIDPLAKVP